MSLEIIVGVVLIVIGNMFCKKWNPPLKPQVHAAFLLTGSAILGHFMFGNFTYGIALGGLVYYKEELLEEVRYVLDVLRPKASEDKSEDKQE